MTVHVLKTIQEVEALLPILMSQPVWGFDTETSGLDCHSNKVTLVQIGNEEDQYVMDSRRVSVQGLRPFFENGGIRKIAHNAKFDYKMMKGTHGIEVEGLRDTMLADKIYHNGRKDRGFALDDVAKSWLDVDIDKSLQKSFIGHVGDYSPEQLQYAAKDVLWLCPLAKKMASYLNQDGQLGVWQMESDCVPCFGDMEFRGVKLNVPKWQAILQRNIANAERVRIAMAPYASEFPHLFRSDLFGNVDINFDSPEQVLKLLKGMRVRVKSIVKGQEVEGPIEDTNDRTLQKLSNYPFVTLLQEYRGYTKRISTYGQNFIDAIHPKTGRIHPQFHQVGTTTGRPASAGDSPVNFLNIPHEPEVRQCFETDDACEVQTDDYSGCELRIWAYLSQDPFLLDAFIRGIDVHCHVATKLYGETVTKKDPRRTGVKSLNFGGH
jgi:DNA polymerase I-like protein with 3'-5' exonuclease and polymerase domains